MFNDDDQIDLPDHAAINDHEFNLAIKEDGSYNNQINNMITDIYMTHNPMPNAVVASTGDLKKSNLKVVSMFDENLKSSQEEFDSRKRVKFVNEQASEMIKKRKLPGDVSTGENSKSKQNRTTKDKLDLIKFARFFLV